MLSRTKHYINYKTTDVLKLLHVLKNPKNPDSVTLKRKYYQFLLKLKDNDVMEIVDIYDIFKKYGVSKENVVNFMNEVEKKFKNEEKITTFNLRDRANECLISGYFCSFYIDHPQEMPQMIYEMIKKHSQNKKYNVNEIKNIIKTKIDQIKPSFPEKSSFIDFFHVSEKLSDYLNANPTEGNNSEDAYFEDYFEDYFDDEGL